LSFAHGSAGNGGAISSGSITISGCSFSNCSAQSFGAAVWTEGGALTDCVFTNNTAGSVLPNIDGFGGAVYTSKTLSITRCTFSSNSVVGRGGVGGAIADAEANVVIRDSTFTGNSALGGGAILIYNGNGTTPPHLTVINSTFFQNSAAYGGAIHNVNGINSGVGNDLLEVTNSTFDQNTATLGGGTVFTTGPMTFIGNTVAESGVTNGGGVIEMAPRSAGNTDGVLRLANNVVAAGTAGVDIRVDPAFGGTVTGTNNLIQDGTGGLPNTIVAAPLLGPLQNNGGLTQTMALLPNSPAINAGNSAAGFVPFSAPGNVAAEALANSGSLPGQTTFSYRVTTVNAFGETIGSTEVSATTGSGGSNAVHLSWDAVPGAWAYRVYGRTAGSEQFLRENHAPALDPADSLNFTDTGAITPAGALPTTNTTVPPNVDQRGVSRPQGPAPDIGAFEVQDDAPTIAASQTVVTVDEGSPASNSGTFDDPQGRGTVTLTASLGTVTENDAAGTWSWSYTPSDGPAGPTTVTITATDDYGLTGTTTFLLTVKNVAPTASITGAPAPGHSPEGTAISLGSAVTDPSSADTAAGFTYAWSVTKNGVAYASGSAADFSFTPDDDGTYVVSLAATDKDGGASPVVQTTIAVDNVAPTAAITGAPASGHSPEGTAIGLGGTVTDPSSVDTAAGFTYAWSVTKDGTAYASGTAASFSFTPDDNGTYVVSLTATDKDGGAGSTSATITVDNGAPTAGVSGPAEGLVGRPQAFTLTASDPSAADAAAGFAYTLDWGDGSPVQAIPPGPGNGAGLTVGHTFAAAGTYAVSVTATDPDGGSGSAGATIVVLSADERFVRALYRDALGRPGALEELDGWVAALHGPGGSRAAVAAGIENSLEGRTRLVDSWYRTYLGRDAHGGEEQGWVGALLAGAREEDVLAGILASPEFYGHARGLPASGGADERFVRALYGLLLGRPAGDAEAAGWVAALPALGRAGVAGSFLGSAEYRTDVVASYYGGLLHRPADPVGWQYWLGSGLDLYAIRLGFESSDEFYANG
jgi:hypothetical protein